MKKALSVCILVGLLCIQACQSQLTHDVKPLDCKPALANPRVDVVQLNTYPINNVNYTLFSILFESPGSCIDLYINPTIHLDIEGYDADGQKKDDLTFDVKPTVMGNQLESLMGFNFNSRTYLKIKATLIAKGKTSDPISFSIKRPNGAN